MLGRAGGGEGGVGVGTECVRPCCARYEHRIKTKTGGAGKYKETCVEFFPPATVRRLWYEMSRTDVFYLQASLGGVPIIPQQFLLWLVTDRHRCLVPFYIKPTVKVAKHQNSLCKIAAGCMLDMTQHSEGLAITHGAELNCRHARNS